MTQEEKAKAYDEAIKRGLDYIRQTPATEMVTRQDVFEAIFPEYAESEDEKIREEMIRYFTGMKKGGSAAPPYDDCIAYLERQKEQKPAKWSEKDADILNCCISSIEEAKENRYAYKETDGDTSYDREIDWLKSLSPSWKPSEEQMEWLKSAVRLSTNKPHIHGNIISLYEQLKRL